MKLRIAETEVNHGEPFETVTYDVLIDHTHRVLVCKGLPLPGRHRGAKIEMVKSSI
jgi:hypothetical protein